MPVIPFLPLVSAGIGAFAGRKAQSSAMQRSPEELAALTGAQGTAGALSAGGQNLLTTGAAAQAPATSYFQSLLAGNRAQQSQAVAAPRAALTDIYRGAQSNLDRSGVRGAQRDVASAELGRQRAGQIGGLITGVQPGAAGALTQIGQQQQSLGGTLTGQAGGIYNALLGQGTANRQYARGEGERAGAGIGGLIFDVLRGVKWPKRTPSGGGGGIYPTGGGGSSTTPGDEAGYG